MKYLFLGVSCKAKDLIYELAEQFKDYNKDIILEEDENENEYK